MRRFLSIMLAMCCFCTLRAQEFRCGVQVNYQKLMNTTQSYESGGDKKVFESMKQAIEDLVNGRRWTNLQVEQMEQIGLRLASAPAGRRS